MSNIKYCFQLLNKPIFTLPFEYLTNNVIKDDNASLGNIIITTISLIKE